MIIREVYDRHDFLLDSGTLKEGEREFFGRVSMDMADSVAAYSLKALSIYLSRYYGKRVIILLDEYDTPLQEAWVNGYWQEMVDFMGSMFNSAFKTNPYMERAVTTGITRVSKESIFSDLNNLEVVTTTSKKYETSFGFTEEEVWEALLRGERLCREIDEQIVFNQLGEDENAVWSLLLAGGYLRVEDYAIDEDEGREVYELALTNKEVYIMFRKMIGKWFSGSASVCNGFIKALLGGDTEAMNVYMNKVALNSFSYFDSGKSPSEDGEPERFYHGFVLGMAVELTGRYVITSNRESGLGRYDVMLEPVKKEDDAMILEFKVRNPKKEAGLEDMAKEALAQIERKQYGAALEAKGILKERIRKYGFAFEGKNVLIKVG